MAWLIGAIVTYAIVFVLIGITVQVYLLGDVPPARKAEQDMTAIRRRPNYPQPTQRLRQVGAPGTGAFGMR